jgi:hypothetical protein
MQNLQKTLFHILIKSLLSVCCLTVTFYEISLAAPNITVCATNCDFTTLQAAINAPDTLAGTVITIREPVHTEAGIVINKDITIQGPEIGEPVVIQAHADPKSSKNRVFRIEEGINVTLRHLIIQHGRAPRSYPPSGGAILNFGTLLLEACLIRNNSAMDGGGILNKGMLTIKNSTLSGNTAHGIHPDPGLSCGTGGAIKCEKGELILNSSMISGNDAAEAGGGLFVACKCTATIENTTIRENKAHEHGGGIRLRGTLTLDHSTIDHNSALIGGGIHVHGTLEFSNTIIADNTRKDCHLVTKHPYKGVGTIVSNTRNLIADQSCESEYFGDPESGPQDIGVK